MAITHIVIENFKGIGAPVRVDFKPITLLYGPNSAGKSTILHALMYAYEVLKNNNCDADRVSFSDEIDLGGFKSLVHGHDLKKKIRISLGYRWSDDNGESPYIPSYSKADSDDFGDILNISDPCGEWTFETAEVTLEVCWSRQLNTPYVSELNTKIGRIGCHSEPVQFATIKGNARGEKLRITNVNTNNDWFECDLEEGSIPFTDQVWDMKDDYIPPELRQEMEIYLKDTKNVIPEFGKPLDLHLGHNRLDELEEEIYELSDDENKNHTYRQAIEEKKLYEQKLDMTIGFFSGGLIGPCEHVVQALHKMIYLGPIREVPGRNYKPQVSSEKKRWSKGIAAWDLLNAEPDEFVESVSKALYELKAGCLVYRKKSLELNLDSLDYTELRKLLDHGEGLQQLREAGRLLDDLPQQHTIRLRTLDGVDLAPQDVGTGISQVLPIAVACCQKTSGLIAVEQPELHIHPALQVELGDLLIKELNRASPEREEVVTVDDEIIGISGNHSKFLLETHSEHLLLRLLKRIRQTDENKDHPEELQLLYFDIGVYYVDTENGQTSITELPISRDGEFEHSWPKGFFEEREEELFH